MDRGTMSGHEPVRDDPGDPLVLRAATIGHRMAMGPGEPALSEWAAAGLDLPDETAMMRYRRGPCLGRQPRAPGLRRRAQGAES